MLGGLWLHLKEQLPFAFSIRFFGEIKSFKFEEGGKISEIVLFEIKVYF